MATKNTTGFMDSLLEVQKNLVSSAVENTKKFTNGNTILNENIEKGSEWYNNWMDNQKKFFGQSSDKATEAAETAKTNANSMAEFFQNWYNTQVNFGKSMWEASQGWMKDAAGKASTNPMEQAQAAYNNWMSQWNNVFSNMNSTNNWMNNMQQWTKMNPFNMDAWKNSANDMTSLFNQYAQMLNNGFSEWQTQMQNGTTQDAFRNMLNSTEGFTRFYQVWAPMWKSIQEKTFNMDVYKNAMNPASFQEFMDKFFGFMPEGSRQYMQQLTQLMQDGAKQAAATGTNGYNQMRQMMATMPGMNTTEGFGQMLSMYEQMQAMIKETVSPITKMMTPNQYTKSMSDWQEIADRSVVYNIKNAQLQYMMYAQGAKVMDVLAQNILHKMEQGEEVKSMMALYQEWLNISDKNFVALFESDEYSELMAEVSALQLKLRKDMEGQVEKAMSNLPIATRSELDELYKTIYDLKKEVRQLSRMLEIDGEVAAQPAAKNESESASSAPKSSTKSKKA